MDFQLNIVLIIVFPDLKGLRLQLNVCQVIIHIITTRFALRFDSV